MQRTLKHASKVSKLKPAICVEPADKAVPDAEAVSPPALLAVDRPPDSTEVVVVLPAVALPPSVSVLVVPKATSVCPLVTNMLSVVSRVPEPTVNTCPGWKVCPSTIYAPAELVVTALDPTTSGTAVGCGPRVWVTPFTTA